MPIASFPAPGAAPRLTAWYVVGLLIALSIFSNVDRMIIALLAPALERDLHITDTGLGLLLGVGFTLVYTLATIPFATWADRGSRRRVICVGAVIWSVMTVLSAFASDAFTFALCRAGLAIGEAALSPAAIALISDLFGKQRRSLPTSLYVSVTSIMITGALAVGAAAYDLAERLTGVLGLAPWRLTLVFCGLPGILIALTFFATVREPPKTASTAREAQAADLRAVLGEVWSRRAIYIPLYLAVAAMLTFVSGLGAWMPTYLIRAFQLSPPETGYLIGVIGVPASLLGAFIWPFVAGRVSKRTADQGPYVCLVLAMVAVAPMLGAMPYLGTFGFVLGMFAAAKMLLANSTIMPPLILTEASPAMTRGRIIAFYLFAMNFGFSLGPVLVPLLAKLWAGEPDAIGRALAALAFGLAPTSALLFAVSWRAFRAERGALTPGRGLSNPSNSGVNP